MNIEELIKELEEIKKEHRNIEVRVQHRGECGYYTCFDDNFEPHVETEHEETEREEEFVVL